MPHNYYTDIISKNLHIFFQNRNILNGVTRTITYYSATGYCGHADIALNI